MLEVLCAMSGDDKSSPSRSKLVRHREEKTESNILSLTAPWLSAKEMLHKIKDNMTDAGLMQVE